MTLQFRFRRHFKILENNCWLWIGSKTKDGYGEFEIDNKKYRAHRVARYIYCGFNLNSYSNINHIRECNNRLCVNPDHTYEGNDNQNNRDRQSFITHCPAGHEYNEKNTHWSGH